MSHVIFSRHIIKLFELMKSLLLPLLLAKFRPTSINICKPCAKRYVETKLTFCIILSHVNFRTLLAKFEQWQTEYTAKEQREVFNLDSVSNAKHNMEFIKYDRSDKR